MFDKMIVKYNGKEYTTYDTFLDLSNKEMKKMSAIQNLSKQINLTRLVLNNNEISEITGIGRLRKLRELYLDENSIQEIKGMKMRFNISVRLYP